MARFKLSNRSLSRLNGVHPDLVKVVKRAIEITEHDFSVAEGVRSKAQAEANAAKGTGIANSLHIPQSDGFAHAVDLHPYPLDWNNLKSFKTVADAVFKAADELGVLIQWGADWNNNGVVGERSEWDYPHFQKPQYERTRNEAKAAQTRRKSL